MLETLITRIGFWHRNVPQRQFLPCIIYWPLSMFAPSSLFCLFSLFHDVLHSFYEKPLSWSTKILRKFEIDVKWSMNQTAHKKMCVLPIFPCRECCEKFHTDKAYDDLNHIDWTSMGLPLIHQTVNCSKIMIVKNQLTLTWHYFVYPSIVRFLLLQYSLSIRSTNIFPPFFLYRSFSFHRLHSMATFCLVFHFRCLFFFFFFFCAFYVFTSNVNDK